MGCADNPFGVFQWQERPVPISGYTPKVPFLSLESAIRTPRKYYRDGTKVTGSSIEVALDAALGGLLELFFADFYFGNLLVGGQLFVQLGTVLLHDVADVVVVETHVLGFVVVGIDESDELVVTLHDDTLYDHGHGVELVLNLLGIDVLAVGAEEHVLAASVDIDVAVVVHGAQVAGMVPAVLVEGLGSGFGVFIIAQHDVGAFGQYLAGDVGGVGAVDFHFHVVGGLSAGAL